MPLEGAVFLALWNDFDPARDAEYERWHTFEHVPERVGVPGILRGRRYRAAERGLDRFFTLYEVRDEGVLTSAAYLDLVQHPTDWSRDMRPSFRNVLRMPCETLLSVGRGTAGHVAAARIDLPRPLRPSEVQELRDLAERAGEGLAATALHVGRVIAALTDYPIFKGSQTSRGGGDMGSLALIAEGGDRASALEAVRLCIAAVEATVDRCEVRAISAYDLVFAVGHAELVRAPNGRLPPRPDLRDAIVHERA